MKYKPIMLGYSWIGLLNLVLLQWLFVRVQATVDTTSGEITKFKIIGPIVPMTGWWSKYIWLKKSSKGKL
jgi:hypothetical protein